MPKLRVKKLWPRASSTPLADNSLKFGRKRKRIASPNPGVQNE